MPAWVARFHVALFGCTGSLRMSMFQTLFSGKTAQAVPGTSAAATGNADGPDTSAKVEAHSARIFFTPEVRPRRGSR